jgi:hypothetical protein
VQFRIDISTPKTTNFSRKLGVRKSSKKSRSPSGCVTVVPFGRETFGGFPYTARTTLKYIESIGINPAAGALGKYIFRANSVYDPNSSGTGHQPLGYDQWSTVYNNYIVMRSTIKCTFISTETSVSCPLACGVVLDDDGTVASSAGTIIEQGKSKFAVINSRDLAFRNGLVLTNTYDPRSYFGLVNPIDNTDSSAVVSTNPARTATFVVWVGDLAEAADLGAIRILVEMLFDTVFFKPTNLVEA